MALVGWDEGAVQKSATMVACLEAAAYLAHVEHALVEDASDSWGLGVEVVVSLLVSGLEVDHPVVVAKAVLQAAVDHAVVEGLVLGATLVLVPLQEGYSAGCGVSSMAGADQIELPRLSRQQGLSWL